MVKYEGIRRILNDSRIGNFIVNLMFHRFVNHGNNACYLVRRFITIERATSITRESGASHWS